MLVSVMCFGCKSQKRVIVWGDATAGTNKMVPRRFCRWRSLKPRHEIREFTVRRWAAFERLLNIQRASLLFFGSRQNLRDRVHQPHKIVPAESATALV